MVADNFPKVAILLAAYNGEKWIEEQVQSILSQVNILPFIFISLDYSSDASLNLCQKLEKQHNNLFLLPYGSRYGSAARNFYRLIRDVDFSNFDYVSLSDQDDIWLPTKTERAINLIIEKNADAVSSDVVAFWGDCDEKIIKKSFPLKKYDFFFEAAGPGCTYLVKSAVLMEFKRVLNLCWGEIEDIRLHDWVIYAYLRASGYLWIIDHIPLVRYRQHEQNYVGANYGFIAYRKRFFLVKSSWYKAEVKKIHKLIMCFENIPLDLNRFTLVKNFWQLRRRPRDALVLLVLNLLGLF